MPFRSGGFGERLTDIESLGALHVQQGKYLFEFNGEVRCTGEDFTGAMGAAFQLTIVDGPDAVGRTFSHNCNMDSEEYAWALGKTLAAAGMTIDSLEALKKVQWETHAQWVAIMTQIAKGCQGRRFVGFVADKESGGKVYSNILEFSKAEEWNGVQTAPGAPAPAAAPATSTPPPPPAPAASVAATLDALFAPTTPA